MRERKRVDVRNCRGGKPVCAQIKTHRTSRQQGTHKRDTALLVKGVTIATTGTVTDERTIGLAP